MVLVGTVQASWWCLRTYPASGASAGKQRAWTVGANTISAFTATRPAFANQLLDPWEVKLTP